MRMLKDISGGINPGHIEACKRYATLAKQTGEHVCNGDSHRLASDKSDKNECSQLWNEELDRHTAMLNSIVRHYGLKVTYTGLYPSLIDCAGNYYEIG